MMLAALLFAAAALVPSAGTTLAPSAAVAVAQPPGGEPDYSTIVVTGTRAKPLEPLLEPIAYFRRHCFDALRLGGRTAPPADDDGDWIPVSDPIRQRLRLDAEIPAFVLNDPGRGHALILKFEKAPRDDGLNETRCTMVVVGGTAHDRLTADMFTLFKGSGTERHLGHPDGHSRHLGWKERLWIGIPRRGSSRWEVYRNHRSGGGAFVRVGSPSLYDRFDWIMGDLKQTVSRTPPVSLITLSHTTRGERRVR